MRDNTSDVITHFLIDDFGNILDSFIIFDRSIILERIISLLSIHKDIEISHEKSLIGLSKKKYVGNDILNFYKNNSAGLPCLIVTKGSREYLKVIGNN